MGCGDNAPQAPRAPRDASVDDAALDAPAIDAPVTACDGCHGANGTFWPQTDAHLQHMSESTWHGQITCNECHLVPASTTEPTHLDGVVEVDLDPAAGTGGQLQIPGATWNAGTRTCTGTYCHGGGGSYLLGGTFTAPVWSRVDGAQSQCTACHGMPPPSPHPPYADCGLCHPTMTAGQPGIIVPWQHVDGEVQVVNDIPCNACHGDPTATPIGGDAAINAPPRDTQGGTSTSLRGVGAHQQHLGPSTWRAPIPCASCHPVPAFAYSIGHIDTPLPAEVMFMPIAGTNAYWNGASCENVYCHGATLTGGVATSPTWTLVDGSQSQCGSCHGLPPPLPHVADADCGKCHASMTAGLLGVITNPSRHIDGNLDIESLACNGCHGDATASPGANDAAINAPPLDTQGNTSTGMRGVGAHQAHLGASSWRAPIPCSTCHVVPATIDSIGHTDTPLPAEVIFSGLGAGGTWNAATCSVYCHGVTLAGGTATSPSWTVVDGSQSQCGSCHGAPPPPPHVTDTDCGTCHPSMTAGLPGVITDPSRHVDGTIDVTVP